MPKSFHKGNKKKRGDHRQQYGQGHTQGATTATFTHPLRSGVCTDCSHVPWSYEQTSTFTPGHDPPETLVSKCANVYSVVSVVS